MNFLLISKYCLIIIIALISFMLIYFLTMFKDYQKINFVIKYTLFCFFFKIPQKKMTRMHTLNFIYFFASFIIFILSNSNVNWMIVLIFSLSFTLIHKNRKNLALKYIH